MGDADVNSHRLQRHGASLLCLLLSSSGHAAAPEAAAQPSSPAIVVSGLASLLGYPNTLASLMPFTTDYPLCVTFWVSSVGGTTPQLRLTSAGLGGARLCDLSKTKAPPGYAAGPHQANAQLGCAANEDEAKTGPVCAANPDLASTSITLSGVSDQGRPVMLILPASAFPDAEAGAAGKLLALRVNMSAAEFPVTVKRNAYAPPMKAFFWFLGIFIPALLTSALGLMLYRLQKKFDVSSSERATLERFERDNHEDLQSFFNGIYKTVMELSDDNFVSTMERELVRMGIPGALPQKARERLFSALYKKDLSALARELADQFHPHQKAIMKPIGQET